VIDILICRRAVAAIAQHAAASITTQNTKPLYLVAQLTGPAAGIAACW
jgi:hypothetical protein